MPAILKKELRNYFQTPIAYIFIAPFLALTGFFFQVGIVSSGSASVNYILEPINMICLFVVPILTMQLLSEERNKKTDQLLLTSPISVWDIVMGKYFAALTVFLITLVITLVFPVILFIVGQPILTEVIGSYIGFLFIWATFIAVGLFISSLTESQVIAAILSFVSLFVLFMFDSIISGINITWLKEILGWFSVFKRYNDFQAGLLNLPTIIYYLSFIFVFLFLTQRNIEKRRFS